MTLNRRNSGKVAFQEAFGAQVHRVPLNNLPEGVVEFRLFLDWSSLEVFVNGGQYVTTSQIFPNTPYNQLQIRNTAEAELSLESLEINEMKSIW